MINDTPSSCRIPPDNNKVIPEVAAPCLIKFTKPGGRRPGNPDIVIPPVNPPGGTGPPPGDGHTGSTGPGGGTQLGWCSCFMHKHELKESSTHIAGYKNCVNYFYSWKQTCEQSNANKEFQGQPANKDPFGGWADYQAILALFWNPPPGKVLVLWGQGGGEAHAWCKDPVKGSCSLKCNTLTLWWVWCDDPAIIEGKDGTVDPSPGAPSPPQPWEGGNGGSISNSAWSRRNIPVDIIIEDPYTYSYSTGDRGNKPFEENSFITDIPSPYDISYVFHNWKSPQVINKATVTTEKGLGDINNIFKGGDINKILDSYLIPFQTTNNIIYNDKTISIFMNKGRSLIAESLSQETLEALELVNQSNMISLTLSEELLEVIYSAVISGNLDLYEPKLFREMYEVGNSIFGQSIPVATPSNSLNFINAMTYISGNLRSLYPKNYPTNGDESRFAAHWLAIPPEYKLSLGVTPRVGDSIAIPVGVNFNFPVYDRDGVKKNINEFLDFFNVLDRDETDRVIPLRSYRSNLYTLDEAKESRIMGLLQNSDVEGRDKLTTTYEVSADNWVTASGYEMNDSPVSLAGAYLLKLELSTISTASNPDHLLRSYTATYKLAWTEGDSESKFNDAIKVYGPHKVAYFPNDPWWSYFTDTSSVEVTYVRLNVEGYLPGRPEVIVGTQIPQTILIVPTQDKVRTNPLNGRSKLSGFEEGTIVTRTFTTTLSPFVETEIYTKPVKDPTEIDLQGDHDIFALKFEKSFSVGYFSGAATDAVITTSSTPIADYINRVDNLKENYTLVFDGGNTLTEFDLYKGFSLNQLLTILSTELGDITKITGVKIIQTKWADLYTPKSFITDTYLKAGGTANTTNYIGGEEFSKIMYFPPEYDYYN